MSAPTCSIHSVSVVWQHQDTLGALDGSHRLSVATWAMPQCCARAQDTGRAQKALNFSNAVMEAAAPPVPLDVLVHFVFTFLRDAVFPPKNYS